MLIKITLNTAWLSMRLILAFSDIQLFAGPAHQAPYCCMHKRLVFGFEWVYFMMSLIKTYWMTLQDVTGGIHCDGLTVSHVRGTPLDSCSLSLQGIVCLTSMSGFLGGVLLLLLLYFFVCFVSKHSEVLSLDTPHCLSGTSNHNDLL